MTTKTKSNTFVKISNQNGGNEMKTIVLNKSNTEHIGGNVYKWTPDNSEPYNLVIDDGIYIHTGGGCINTSGGNIDTDGGNIHTSGGYIETSGGYIETDGGNIDTSGGNIETSGGNIYTDGGSIYTDGGNIHTSGGYIHTGGGYIETSGGYIETSGGNIYTSGGYINTSGGNIDTGGGNIYTDGGYIYTKLLICGILYWEGMSMPDAKNLECKIVYPSAKTRKHWKERLSDWVDISDGCYDELLGIVRPHLDDILASDKWSNCERWIIESWRK